jgi:hypothetical protein
MLGTFLHDIFNIDRNSLILVLMLCTWGFMIIQIMVPVFGFAVLCYPVLVVSSLAAYQGLTGIAYVQGMEKAAAVAFATGVGMSIAVVFLIVIFYLLSALIDPSAPERLDLPRSSRTKGQ